MFGSKLNAMTRIKVFKTSTVFARFFIIFGSFFSILGIVLIVKASSSGFNFQFPSGDWNSVIYTLQGFLFIIMGTANLINNKYYIEWDDTELSFLLPDTKKMEKIQFSDIISVDIRLFEIQLNIPDKTRILDLNNLQFEDLRKIKEKFEAINKTDK